MDLTQKLLSVAARLTMTTDKKELLKLAAELGSISASTVNIKETCADEKCTTGFLKFTQKEIMRMPQKFRKEFRAGRLTAHVRKKENGVYEIRIQYHGERIEASAKLLEIAKERFLKKLSEYTPAEEKRITPKIPLTEYMARWLDTVRRPTVKEETYAGYYSTYKNYILPTFQSTPISAVKAFDLQELISRYSTQGKNRTAKKIYQLLKSMFDAAVADGLILHSPMSKVILQPYEVENGVPLTLDEERAFIKKFLADPTLIRQAFTFMLYTGIRRAELGSVRILDGWVEVSTAKRRKGFKPKYRKIPISPILKRLLPLIDAEAIKAIPPIKLTHAFPKEIPGHHTHDLRHTFITRAQGCKIQRELVSFWAGHKPDTSVTSTVYTHFEKCPEVQIEEMLRFDYEI